MKHTIKQSFGIAVSMLITAISFSQVTDYDGNVYNTVTIGNQIWLKENLQSLHYADGTEITEVWAYNDNENNVPIYGRLYTWNGAMNYNTVQGAQGVCPDGWHIPTHAEWTDLGLFLGGNSVAGGKMKSIGTQYWQSPNTGATNESGFTGLPAGEWDSSNNYWLMGVAAVIWSSTQTSSTFARYRSLSYDNAELLSLNYLKNFRYSVRCIKNSSIGIGEIRSIEEKLIISPNPAGKTVLIQLLEQTDFPCEIYFYNSLGQFLKTSSIQSNNTDIDVSDIPIGTYIVKIIFNNEVISKKLIKN